MMLSEIQLRDMLAPERNRIKQREAQRYLKRLGHDPKLLDKWIKNGLLRKTKDGNGNCPVWYSLKDIQRLIAKL